nr:srp-independent targeting protein 2 like [Quercus suber]
MAQKSAKTLAAKNTASLNRAHLIALGVNVFYLLLRTLFFTRRLTPYVLCNAPALLIEFFFERNSRPHYSPNGDLKRAGEDLEAKGLTEWMWDIVYWSWGNLVVVAVLGDWAWWFYLVVPAYSAWLAFTTYAGVKQGFGGMGRASGVEGSASGQAGQSKRQAKMEKRGGQRVAYRADVSDAIQHLHHCQCKVDEIYVRAIRRSLTSLGICNVTRVPMPRGKIRCEILQQQAKAKGLLTELNLRGFPL